MKKILLLITFLLSCDDVDKFVKENKEDIKDLTQWMNYGNYCGINDLKHTNPIPVDDIDACCKEHDLAYRAIVKSGDRIHVGLCEGDAQEDADNKLVECVESLPEDMYQWNKMPEDMIYAEWYIQGIRALFGWCE